MNSAACINGIMPQGVYALFDGYAGTDGLGSSPSAAALLAGQREAQVDGDLIDVVLDLDIAARFAARHRLEDFRILVAEVEEHRLDVVLHLLGKVGARGDHRIGNEIGHPDDAD